MRSGTKIYHLNGAVMAHPKRVEQAQALATALGAERTTVVFDPNPGGKPSALRTTIAAWSSIPHEATHRVVLHDDMTPAAAFWEQAEAAVQTFPEAALALCAFWNSRNGAAVRLATLAGARWVEPVNEYFPCTALILPKDVALGYAEFARQAGDAWPEDVLLYRYLRRARVPAYISAPSLAQHQDFGSLSGNDFHGPRRSACFHEDPRRLELPVDSTLTGLQVVPFFKHGAAQCAVRVPGTSRVRWESVATERYLARLGIASHDLEARFAKASAPNLDPVGVRGTWLTAYAMGIVGSPKTQRRDDMLADMALATIVAGGMCHRLGVDEIEELQRELHDLARAAWESGLEDRLDLPAWPGQHAATRSSAKPVVVLGGGGFPGAQITRGLADCGHRIVSIDTHPTDETYPDLEYRVERRLTESGLASLFTDAYAVVNLTCEVDPSTVENAARLTGVQRLIRLAHADEIYGPGMSPTSRVSVMVTQALMSSPITVDPEAPNPVRLRHMDDIVNALDSALTRPAPGGWLDVEGTPTPALDEPDLGRLVARAVRPVPVVEAGADRIFPPDDSHGESGPAGWAHGRQPIVDPVVGLRAFGQWVAYESDAPWK